MKVLSDELQQAVLDVVTQWREIDADLTRRAAFVRAHPDLSMRLIVLDQVASGSSETR